MKRNHLCRLLNPSLCAVALGLALTAHGQTFEQVKAAADKGDVKAQVQVGLAYMNSQDAKEAVKYFKKASKTDPVAQLNLGVCYALGEGASSKPDPKEAANWFKKASDQGLTEAQFRLAYCYEHGQGVAKNDAEALKLYRKVAEAGSVDAQVIIAGLYKQGLGTGQDYAEAARWFTKAAEVGNAEAQYQLGVSYSLGQGVPRDYVESYKWFIIAANQGRKDAVDYRDKLPTYYKMTADQVAQAETRAKGFAPK